MELTKKAKIFLERNVASPIYKAAWLDENKKQPDCAPEKWAFIKFWFTNGDTMTLKASDMDSINQNNMLIRWSA